MNYRMLERYEGKLSRTVLRRGIASNRSFNYINDPYYEDTNLSNENFVIRSQAKKSTNFFLRIFP
ncbi:MAG: hypothetical protein JG777_1756 [Clostridia bacterium]|nr:hypothetical protein [Clostridia bacterium]